MLLVSVMQPLKLKRVGILLFYVIISATDAANVTISGSGPVVCSQDRVTFTCTVTSGVLLVWIAEPFVTNEQNQVVFLPSDLEANPTRTIVSNGVTLHAVLTDADPVPGSGGLYTLHSTLRTTASINTNGTVIVCLEHFSEVSANVTLQVQDVTPPPQPSDVWYNVIFYGTSYLKGDIEWDFSTNSPVDNFTITVSYLNGSIGIMRTTESSPVETVTLYYNTNYTITVIGRNCGGSSMPAVLSYIEYGCPVPSNPVNGSVSDFTSARVGSNITYHCDIKLLLVGEKGATCTPHLVWVPNGSDIMCQQAPPGDCGDPGELTNGMVIFSNGTTEGSVITFQCNSGFSIGSDRMSWSISQQWALQPQNVQCIASTKPEKSNDTIVTTVCECTDITEPTRTNEFSTAAVAVIVCVPSIVISFFVGALLGALLHHCFIIRMHNKPQSQSQTQNCIPTYENVEDIALKREAIAEIELKSNEAYGPVRQKQISTRANKAYSHVQL